LKTNIDPSSLHSQDVPASSDAGSFWQLVQEKKANARTVMKEAIFFVTIIGILIFTTANLLIISQKRKQSHSMSTTFRYTSRQRGWPRCSSL